MVDILLTFPDKVPPSLARGQCQAPVTWKERGCEHQDHSKATSFRFILASGPSQPKQVTEAVDVPTYMVYNGWKSVERKLTAPILVTSCQTYEEQTDGYVKMNMPVWLRKLLEEADVDLTTRDDALESHAAPRSAMTDGRNFEPSRR